MADIWRKKVVKRLFKKKRSKKCVVMDHQLNNPFLEEGDSNDQIQLAQLCVSLWGKTSGLSFTAQRHS